MTAGRLSPQRGQRSRTRISSEFSELRENEIMKIPEVVRAYVDAFMRRDVDACFDETFASDGTYSSPSTSHRPISAAASKEHFRAFFAGFPDATCETVGLDNISENLTVYGGGSRVEPIPVPIAISQAPVGR